MMRSSLGFALIAASASLLACGQPGAHGDDLTRDLDLAGSHDGLTLAPTGTSTRVVSSIERAPTVSAPAASRKVTSYRHSSATAKKAPVASTSSEQERPTTLADAPSPVTEQTPTVIVAPRPSPGGGSQNGNRPKGGWSTVGDVIRNAPFPINP
jgi:hypothetical protein